MEEYAAEADIEPAVVEEVAREFTSTASAPAS